jgi:hypothetical protein
MSRSTSIIRLFLLGVFIASGCRSDSTARDLDDPESIVTNSPTPPEPSQPQIPAVHGVELISYLGGDIVRAVAVQGEYAYVGFGIQLSVIDISNPDRLTRVGTIVLSDAVLDVAVAGSYAYLATGQGGLQVIDLTDPTAPLLLHTRAATSYTSAVLAVGSYLYVTDGALNVMDISDPRAPLELAHFSPTYPSPPVGNVIGASGHYVYTVYDTAYDKAGGLWIFDLSDPTAPTVVGNFQAQARVQDGAATNGFGYLLVGQATPHLVVIDLSEPERPRRVDLDSATSWPGQRLTTGASYVYLVDPTSGDRGTVLQVLDSSQPNAPVLVGSFEGLNAPIEAMLVVDQTVYVGAGHRLILLDLTKPDKPVRLGLFEFETLPAEIRGVDAAERYVYLAAGTAGLLVVDVSDPVHPHLLSSVDTPGYAWDLYLVGRYAYVADENRGLRVIDVGDPLRPKEIGFYDLAGPYEFFHGLAATRDGLAQTSVYLADGGLETGLRILDISDPALPVVRGFLPVTTSTQEILPARAEDVAVVGHYAFIAAGTVGVRVVDVSDPTSPVERGSYNTPGRADNLVATDHYVYLIDGDLRILDISNPTTPTLIGFYDLPNLASTPSIDVQGRYAYVAGAGLHILDVADAGAPQRVAWHPIPEGVVAVAGDRVYVGGDGLFILRIVPVDRVAPHLE